MFFEESYIITYSAFDSQCAVIIWISF